MIGAETGWPATRRRIGPIETHLGLLSANAGAAICVIGAVYLGAELVIKHFTVIICFFQITLSRLNIKWFGLLLWMRWARVAIQLPVICLQLAMHLAAFPTSKRFRWLARILVTVLYWFTPVKLIWAFADIDFAIQYGRLRLHSTLQCFLLTQFGHAWCCYHLRVYDVASGQARRFLTINDVTLSAPTRRRLSVIFIPTLLDLMCLLWHLTRDHICLLMVAHERARLLVEVCVVSAGHRNLVASSTSLLLIGSSSASIHHFLRA